MDKRWMRVLGLTALAAVFGLMTLACDDSDGGVLTPPTGGGSGSNLTVTNASPADGDATLTVTGTMTVNAFGTGYDELNLSETTGSVGHDVTITWDTSTHALHGAQHGWGSGFTQCVIGTANPCNPANVAIDVVGRQVTFTNLVLIDDTFGTAATCTLNGTARW